jgi:hypothetical protein
VSIYRRFATPPLGLRWGFETTSKRRDKGRNGEGILEIQQRIIKFVTRSNWILFGIASILGFVLLSRHVALGILFGGLLVTINFHLLAKTLKKALTPPHLASHNLVLAKYYLRFLISGFIIFLLIASRIAHPVGLVIGLSIVVLSIVLATVREIKKLIFKEAV